jgi:hypothetical protein
MTILSRSLNRLLVQQHARLLRPSRSVVVCEKVPVTAAVRHLASKWEAASAPVATAGMTPSGAAPPAYEQARMLLDQARHPLLQGLA